jgi:shikimate dehydrogenase
VTRAPARLVLLGHPVAHSLSPRIHNAALDAAGIPLRYEALDVLPAELQRATSELVAAEAAGNVTIPHKIAFEGLCDELTMIAEQAGVVNTWWVDDGRLVGDNTDVFGTHAAAQEVLGHTPYHECVALIGTGGAAAGVLAAIASWPRSSARVYGRNRDRMETLCAQFPDVARASSVVREALREATLVINATPVGLQDDRHPVPLELVPTEVAVLDLVYREGETSWVRAARARGHRAADGLTMLLEQGALSFERWFGMNADRIAMRGAVARPA